MSNLEQDFDLTIAQVNAKLAEAAKAIREATALAERVGYKSGLILTQFNQERENMDWDAEDADDQYEALEEKYDAIDVSDLEDALDSAGWSTSSSYC